MHTCQTIANYSSYAILSCSDCLEQCQTLYNHSAFCILECHAPTTTTPVTTTPLTTTPLTTTPIVTTTITTPIVTTPIPTTPIWTTPVATTTNMITTSLLTTTAISDKITLPTIADAPNTTSMKYERNNFSVGVTRDTNIETNNQGFFAFILVVIPILFLVCVVVSYICRRKKSLARKKSRTVLPLVSDEVVINVENKNEEETTTVNENVEDNTKDMIIKTVVASVVDDMIGKVIQKAKLPSVSDAAKSLQGLRLAKRKLLRQRKKRERDLHNLVLRNMKQQNVKKKGMTIKEIFEHSNQNLKNQDFDII